jgi:hypothetical protein
VRNRRWEYLENVAKKMGKPPKDDKQWEKIRFAIWASPDPNGPTVADLESLGFTRSTIYRSADRFESTHEIERVKVDGVQHFKPTLKTPLVSTTAQDSILEVLNSETVDSTVKLQAWRDLDAFSMECKITSEPLLKFLLQTDQVRTERALRILTRQAIRSLKEPDKWMLEKMRNRLDQTESIVRDREAEMNTRDAAFLFLKVLNPAEALSVALDLIGQEDAGLDSDAPTQLLLDISATIIDAPSTVINQLYKLASTKTLAAERAKKLLQARNQPFRALMTTPSEHVSKDAPNGSRNPPNPTTGQQ